VPALLMRQRAQEVPKQRRSLRCGIVFSQCLQPYD
jgi:hypothetical protein